MSMISATKKTLANELLSAEIASAWIGSHVIFRPRIPNGLLPLGCHGAKVSQAGRLHNASVVKRVMLSALHNLKILWAIVVLNAIDVMNDFTFSYRPANGGRRHKDMLADVAPFVGIRMIRRSDKHIAGSSLVPAAVVAWISFAAP